MGFIYARSPKWAIADVMQTVDEWGRWTTEIWSLYRNRGNPGVGLYVYCDAICDKVRFTL